MATKSRGGDRHVYCFVPSEEIEIVVLAAYLQSYIDGSATIKPSRHPRDRDRLGFTVGANATLGREALEDLIQDSKEWEREQGSREFQEQPYKYDESDAWARRKRLGPTRAPQPRVIEGRRRGDREPEPRTMPGRHDPKYPGTASEIASSYASTNPSSIFSRPAAEPRSMSELSEDTLAPSDSASQVQYSTYGRGDKPPPPKPSGPQPDPDSFKRLGISDNTRPNQSAQRQQTTSKDRHAPVPEKDTKTNTRPGAKSSNRKDQLYDDTYH